jgi:site-specific DNA-adenine methylase
LPAQNRFQQVGKYSDMTNNRRVLRPFFSFYGGKWRDTPRYYPEPVHDTVIEPFAGSAGYSVRYYWKKVILCEPDDNIFGVWDFLLNASDADIANLPDRIEPSGTVDDLAITQEAKNLIGFWLNRGVASPRKRPSKWMRDDIRPGSFWGERVKTTIRTQLRYIRHWEVRHTRYQDLRLSRAATWFIDPPYQVTGGHYRWDSNLIDYDHLAAWCRNRRGQVIVCENEGASWLPFKDLGHTKTTRKGTRSKEVLWHRQRNGAR